jgi:transcriptional regulator with XRE-family HTH domain
MMQKKERNPRLLFRLQEVCDEKKIKVADLCRRAHLSPSAASDLITGRNKMPSDDTLVAISVALDCAPGEFFSLAPK